MKGNKESLRKKLDEFQKMLDAWKDELDSEDYQSTGDPIFVPVTVPVPVYAPAYPSYYDDPCRFCSNNPMNNPHASGFCCCALPAMRNVIY